MRNGSRLLSLIAAFSMALPMVSASALADGVTVRHDSAVDAWSAVSERDQFCIINYFDGVEKMIVSIQLDSTELGSADKVAWLLPLPAAPDQVSLKLMSIVPRLDGAVLSSAAAHRVVDDQMWLLCPYASQLYTLPFVLSQNLVLGYGGTGGMEDVQTFGSVIGFGVTSEVIGTSSSDALEQYMESMDLTLPGESKALIDDYVGKDYSLVLSWISNVPEFKRVGMRSVVDGILTYVIGVAVEFPTDRIYFPLRLTGAYGDLEIPVTVQVLGHATPTEYPSGGGVKVSWKHCIEDEYEPVTQADLLHDHNWYIYSSSLDFEQIREDFRYFFAEQAEPGSWGTYLRNIDYTLVTVGGPSSGLTEDLWMADTESAPASAAGLVWDYPWIVPIATLFVASGISGMLTSLIVFRGCSVPNRKFAALGLLNVLTLLGLYLGYVFLVERRADPSSRILYRKACATYVLYFSFLFLLITALVQADFYLLSLVK